MWHKSALQVIENGEMHVQAENPSGLYNCIVQAESRSGLSNCIVS